MFLLGTLFLFYIVYKNKMKNLLFGIGAISFGKNRRAWIKGTKECNFCFGKMEEYIEGYYDIGD